MPENKRALHNAMERKRRDSIKVGDPNTLLKALIKVPGSNPASPTMTAWGRGGDLRPHRRPKIKRKKKEIS